MSGRKGRNGRAEGIEKDVEMKSQVKPKFQIPIRMSTHHADTWTLTYGLKTPHVGDMTANNTHTQTYARARAHTVTHICTRSDTTS